MAETIAALSPALPAVPALKQVAPRTLFIAAWALCLFGLVLMRLSGGNALTLENFRTADSIWVGVVVLSLVLAFFLRETGTGRRA